MDVKHKALVFDSGVGGLSVVGELRARLPDLHIIYVADDDFRPYGGKTAAQLKARLPGLLKTLEIAVRPDAIVIACNTASTIALADIRARVDVPVIGVVPAIKPAARASKRKAIAVLGTPATVAQKYVGALIADFAGDCQVVLHGSTALVELAERKLSGLPLDMTALKAEIMPVFAGIRIDTIVLACTHFPLLVNELKAVVPYPVNWIDSGSAIAARTQSVLSGIEATHIGTPQTALLIGGQANAVRTKMFKSFGFEKTVNLPA